jgi:hypothetical protein
VGQVVTARAALELLLARAESAAAGGPNPKPWPEFAEYACFACHKDLQAALPPQKDRAPGVLPWGTWYLTMVQAYAGERGEGKELDASLRKVATLMQRPGPDASGVAREAASALKTLDGLLGRALRSGATSPEVRERMKALAADGARRAGTLDWDEATQFYLALAALYQGLCDMGEPAPAPVRADLIGLRNRLKGAFPPGFHSPRLFNPRQPKLSDPFEDILRHLGK